MTADFYSDWSRAQLESGSVYELDQSFENIFLKVTERLEFSNLWTFVDSLGLSDYKLDEKFEKSFLTLLDEKQFANLDSYEDTWEAISKTIVDDTYRFNHNFDEAFFEYSYCEFFKVLSKQKGNFVNSVTFNEHYEEVVKNLEHQQTKPTKSIGQNKSKQHGLKCLLDARLKRLKLMQDYMKTCKDHDSKKVTYICKKCGFKSLWQRKLFHKHIIPVHIKSSMKSKNKSKRRKKKKPRKESNISRRYICANLYCAQSFASIKSRKRHMNSVHTGNLAFECSLCSKAFRDKHDVERHARIHHSRYKKHACPVCSFKTTFRSSLLRHEKRMHRTPQFDRVGKIICAVCRKTFTSEFSLRRHSTAHEAILIGFDCAICGNVKLENHSCVFKCPKCEKTMRSKASLKAHVKLHSKLDSIQKSVTLLDDHDDIKKQLNSIQF